MDSNHRQTEAVGLLQELGLKEYEAKSFVALSRVSNATAKDIADISDVPRTRVYDAIRVLEAKGLVEVQHSNPQRFRAVPIDEAVNSLETLYESRVESLRTTLEGIEPVEQEGEDVTQEIWALSGATTVEERTRNLIDGATEEVVLVVGSDTLLTEGLLDALEATTEPVDVIIGGITESSRDRIKEEVPEAKVFVSGLEWLHKDGHREKDDVAIGRLLLVDRGTILVSTLEPQKDEELAIFGQGFGNGLVVIARRLMATGLLEAEDPGRS